MGRLGLFRARRAVRQGRQRWAWVVALAGACAVGASGGALWGPGIRPATGQSSTSSGAPAAGHPGRPVYERHCATCHGATGGADGPGASALPIKPPPLTDGRLLNPLSDDFLATVVREGAVAVGLAPQMPGFGRLLTEREIRDVVAYIRTLARPPYRPRPTSAVLPVAPAPVQPIEFSHAIHAGSYGIACQYCHADARRGVYAGLPSVARCMGCHKIVAAQGNPEVQKVHEYWNQKRAIPWVRIHKLAGFVYFPHKRHVQVGLTCQTCHGPVETMQRVAQVAPLTMGWCVACHAERRGPLDCVICHH
jgi:mono/diheme cytochrome c family protein